MKVSSSGRMGSNAYKPKSAQLNALKLEKAPIKKIIKKMMLKSSGRQGSKAHKPVNGHVAAQLLAKPKAKIAKPKAKSTSHQTSLAAVVQAYVDQRKLGISVVDWDDDELRGLTFELAHQQLGVAKPKAVRLVAKVAGLLQGESESWARSTGHCPAIPADRAQLRRLVIAMLSRDSQLRLSEEGQRRYAACGDSCNGKERVTESIQKQVCREFGFDGHVNAGLETLRSASWLFPADTSVTNAAFYLRNNIHVNCPLQVGSTVPDVPLVRLDNAPTSVHALLPAAELTVLCAGSGTWPPFRYDLPLVTRFQEQLARRRPDARCQFALVYIREAHASDTWPLKWSFEAAAPRSLEERIAYAERCTGELGAAAMTVAVDDMANEFNTAFGAWPICYYVVHETGKLLHVGNAPEAAYDVNGLFRFLRAYNWSRTATPAAAIWDGGEDNESEMTTRAEMVWRHVRVWGSDC